MKYLQRSPFSVPVAPPAMTDGEWAAIWAPKCRACGCVLDKMLEKGAERCLPCAVKLTVKRKRK